ncbi:MAG: 2-C-methyl-D-erythritol 4-phosphate cytidylyltransferase [Dethiobacteria bacterium]|jgi:2-C-methyl-D-erythritol 4-phosphate cytidylyltransferase
MFVSAVIAAAGKGKRMQSYINKQYLPLLGRPILAWTLEVFFASGLFHEVIVVVAPGEKQLLRRLVLEPYFMGEEVKIVVGGAERQHSVYNALNSLDPQAKIVCIHDGARPLVTASILEAAIQGASRCGAAVSAVPVKDTIKEERHGFVATTIPRSQLRAVHTPQCFERSLLERAHQEARNSGFCGTDDASLVEHLGEKVCFTKGSYENIKVTTPEDILIAEAFLKQRRVKE